MNVWRCTTIFLFRVEIYAHENNDLKKRLENQESLNKSLLGQLRHLHQMLGRAGSNTASTCIMVFLLCFSLILVGMPDRLQTMRPPQSVLVVSNIHKVGEHVYLVWRPLHLWSQVGYGSIGSIQRTQMTAMQRYFPPDINGLLENHYDHILTLSNNDSGFVKAKNKGNEPVDSIFHVNNVLITSTGLFICLCFPQDNLRYGLTFSFLLSIHIRFFYYFFTSLSTFDWFWGNNLLLYYPSLKSS